MQKKNPVSLLTKALKGAGDLNDNTQNNALFIPYRDSNNQESSLFSWPPVTNDIHIADCNRADFYANFIDAGINSSTNEPNSCIDNIVENVIVDEGYHNENSLFSNVFRCVLNCISFGV